MDFSLGNALLPLTYVANYAFEKANADLNIYHLNMQLDGSTALGKLHHKLSNYFTARGIADKNWCHGLPNHGLMVTGGGTSEAFEYIIRALAEDVKERERVTGEVLKPVILMPVPTYGYFFNNLNRWGIEIVKIERDMKNGGRLDPQELAKTFRLLKDEGKRIVAYYDSNPNNPTGLVRGEAETREIADILMTINYYYEQEDDKNVRSGAGFKYNGLTSRIKIIDDMVYDGLEYEGQEKPCSFAQLRGKRTDTFNHSDIFRDTFTLFGASKAGLASLRVGVLIGDSNALKPLRDIQQQSTYFPPMTSYHASLAYFTTEEDNLRKRESHLAKLNAAHEIRGKLMKCLINGVDATPEVSREDFSNLVRMITTETGKSETTARKMLKTGIEGIEVITMPQSGFFHLIDFGGLKGMSYNDVRLKRATGYLSADEYKDFKRPDGLSEYAGHQIKSLEDITVPTGMAFAAPNWLGLDKDSIIVRASFAAPVADIIEMADRLRKFSSYLHKVQPEMVREALPSLQPLPV